MTGLSIAVVRLIYKFRLTIRTCPSGFDTKVLVLNISGQATNRLQLGDQSIDFKGSR